MRSNSKVRLERLTTRHRDAVVIDGAVHRQDQVLVSADQSDHAREAGAGFVERVETFDEIGVHRLRLRASARVVVPEFTAQLREQGVRSASPNHMLHGEPNWFGGPYGAPQPCDPVKGPVPTGTGRDVTVAVFDTGITPHPWFTGTRWWSQVTPDQLDPLAPEGDYETDAQSSHGTFVAGVVLQKAPNTQLWIERVLDDVGVCDELELLHAFDHVQQREKTTGVRVDVVNLSLGGYAHHDTPSPMVAEALRRFGSHTVVVTAAGNNSSNRPFWPAALKDCVAVSTEAPFSDRGWWVDANAPGVDVAGPFAKRAQSGELNLGFAKWSGTSFAAPYVAGAVAQLSNEKGMSAREAAEILLNTANPDGDPEFGVKIR